VLQQIMLDRLAKEAAAAKKKTEAE